MKENHYIVYHDEYSAKLNEMNGTVVSIRAEEARPNGSCIAESGRVIGQLREQLSKTRAQYDKYRCKYAVFIDKSRTGDKRFFGIFKVG